MLLSAVQFNFFSFQPVFDKLSELNYSHRVGTSFHSSVTDPVGVLWKLKDVKWVGLVFVCPRFVAIATEIGFMWHLENVLQRMTGKVGGQFAEIIERYVLQRKQSAKITRFWSFQAGNPPTFETWNKKNKISFFLFPVTFYHSIAHSWLNFANWEHISWTLSINFRAEIGRTLSGSCKSTMMSFMVHIGQKFSWWALFPAT